MGFSLIELLCVLAILSVVTMLAIPSFEKMLSGSEDRRLVWQFADALRRARETALVSNLPSHLKVDVENKTYDFEEAKLRGGFAPGSMISGRVALSDIAAAGRVNISFYPDGTSNGATFSIAQGKKSWTVSVDWLTGRVDTEEQ